MFPCEFYEISNNAFFYKTPLVAASAHSLWCTLSSFSQSVLRLLLSKRFWKRADTIFFRKYRWKVLLPVLYLFNYDSCKSTFFMLNMAFDFVLNTIFVKYSLRVLKYEDYKNILLFAQPVCFDMYFSNKNLIVLLHGDTFSSFLTYVSTSHFQQWSRRWKNDNISFNVSTTL